jgi:hypothetical protein
MTKEELEKKLDDLRYDKILEQEVFTLESQILNIKQNRDRARSITVGTAFGGTTEVSMRGDAANLWVIMQPSEVLELIHQLAGNIGCHINIKPREDFGSWRGWNKDASGELLSYNPHPPHPEIAHNAGIGLAVATPIVPTKQITGEKNEPLAITKTVNKRKSKRTTTPT